MRFDAHDQVKTGGADSRWAERAETIADSSKRCSYRYRAEMAWRELLDRYGDREHIAVQPRAEGSATGVERRRRCSPTTTMSMIDTTIVAFKAQGGAERSGPPSAEPRRLRDHGARHGWSVADRGTGARSRARRAAAQMAADRWIDDKAYVPTARPRTLGRRRQSHGRRAQTAFDRTTSMREQYKARHLLSKTSSANWQAVPCDRYTLRQDRTKFPRRHPPRRRYHLAQLTTRPSSPVRFEEFPEMETRAGRNLDRNLRIIGRFQSRWH